MNQKMHHVKARPGLRFKKGVRLLVGLVLSAMLCTPLHAASMRQYQTDYSSYTYNTQGEKIPAPVAYEPELMINADRLGVDSLSGMTSIFYRNDKVYIAASNAVHIMSSDFELLDTLSTYTLDDAEATISNPGGLFVDEHENIYVTEPARGRILLFGPDLQLIRAMEKPDAVGLEGYTYEPSKLAVDSIGRMFVVSRNIYEGILELSPTGSFTRFYGTNNVTFNPAELFWRSISTEAQRQRQALWLPTDFSNVSINPDGFIFASIQDSTEPEPIKLLNSKGEDILRFPEGRNMRPAGDMGYVTANSAFIAIDNNQDGSYVALDSNQHRLFVYNHDGYLLYTAGGQGNTERTFLNAVDVKFMNDRILVVDQLAQNIRVLRPTEYGHAINLAVHADISDDPDAAALLWTEVAEMNPQFDLAYISMGDAAYREGRFDDALSLYEAGRFRRGYSDAKEQVRTQWIDDNITLIIAIFFILVLVLTWFLIVKPNLQRRRAAKEARQKGVRP